MNSQENGVLRRPAESQLQSVWEVMRDRQWHTLSEIAERAGCPQASASARLRDLRKAEFGGYCIERQYAQQGLWRYRIVDPQMSAPVSGGQALPQAGTFLEGV